MVNQFGFGNSKEHPEETMWDEYVGRPVCAHCNGNTVYGILKEIRIKNEIFPYACFQPSIVGSPAIKDEISELNLIEELPTKALLPITVIRPLKKGVLEKLIEDSKKAREKSEK